MSTIFTWTPSRIAPPPPTRPQPAPITLPIWGIVKIGNFSNIVSVWNHLFVNILVWTSLFGTTTIVCTIFDSNRQICDIPTLRSFPKLSRQSCTVILSAFSVFHLLRKNLHKRLSKLATVKLTIRKSDYFLKIFAPQFLSLPKINGP